jgi:cytochrome P450 PksS
MRKGKPMNDLSQLKIASREFKANPYPYYARLRAEAPVQRVMLPDKQRAWLVSRYDDVLMVLKDDQRFVKDRRNALTEEQLAKQPWVPPMFRPFTSNILEADWENHQRLRSLIHKAFTPRAVEQLEARIEQLAHELLDQAERRGSIDLIRDYALPIPLTIISEMLGVPEADREPFHRGVNAIMALQASNLGSLMGIPHLYGLTRLLKRLIRDRREHLGDDLLSGLIEAEQDGEKLNADELLSMVLVLLIAGHETTINLIGSGMLALIEHPDQMQLLRSQPDLTKNAVEELLRFVSPVEQATERYAREDTTLYDVTIPKGGLVYAVIASANRDERHYPQADTLDIQRQDVKHLAFGQGVHYCVGAPLARMEGRIAIQVLVQRWPVLQLGVPAEKLRWRPGLTVRGLEALPLQPQPI